MLTGQENEMQAIQASEAKARMAELLRAVEQGERFSITRHGKTIAQLLPADHVEDQARQDAVARFRTLQASWKKASFSLKDIQDARHEGHRV